MLRPTSRSLELSPRQTCAYQIGFLPSKPNTRINVSPVIKTPRTVNNSNANRQDCDKHRGWGTDVAQIDQFTSRRRLLQFLAASPLLTYSGAPAFAQEPSTTSRLPDPMVWSPRELDKLISDPGEALDVFDFEPVAKKNVPVAHFGYMVTGIDDEVTLRANREGFQKFHLRPRRLVDVAKIDLTTEILGQNYDSPIVIAPTGSNRGFHPEADIAVARAAKTADHLLILSSVATTSIEDAIATADGRFGFS